MELSRTNFSDKSTTTYKTSALWLRSGFSLCVWFCVDEPPLCCLEEPNQGFDFSGFRIN